MRVAICDVDNTGFPNLALMKISAWHKERGDSVEWFLPINTPYDKVYASKIFNYTPDNDYLPHNAIKGGTGYDIKSSLPEEIHNSIPDHSIYECDYRIGFTTRGCPNNCAWCVVPEKEPEFKDENDIMSIAQDCKEVVLMDNNIIASEWGIKQLEIAADNKIKIDINQGVDARLIDDSIAKLFSKIRWLHPVRLACDNESQIEPIRKAVELLRWRNVKPERYSCYVLVKDIPDAIKRLKFLKGMALDPFAQPYRDKEGNEPTRNQKRLARWCNHKATFKSVWWEDYK